MKAPDHPVPSGDRAMARALVAALAAGGHDVAIVSDLRTWSADPHPDALREIEAAAAREAARIAAGWAAEGPPDVWFTYHSYYRAPDLLGPALSRRFGLPYALAEASHAEKRRAGPWAPWHAANAAAIRAAAVHISFTARDAAGLAGLVAPERIVMLPPFLAPDRGLRPSGENREPIPARRDGTRVPEGRSKPGTPACEAGWGGERRGMKGSRTAPSPLTRRCAPPSPRRGEKSSRPDADPVRLATVAMMRPGKLRSYALLAEALAALPPALDWRLAVAGDGPERDAVEGLFAACPSDRVVWHGALAAEAVAALFADADLFVWPGFREPFGVAYLEAQAAGLPVLAMASGGVASVVEHGRTGLLVPEGDVAAYAAALGRLMTDRDLRERLGREGRRMVEQERTVAGAARILDAALGRALAAAA